MDDIGALLGLGIDDADQTRALADGLRGRKRAADMFSLSTVGNIAKGAQREQDSIMEGAKRGGVLRQTLADRASKEEQAGLDRGSRETIAGNTLREAVRNNKATNLRNWANTSGEEYINELTGETVTGIMTPEGLKRSDGTDLDELLFKKRKDPNTGYGSSREQIAADKATTRRVERLDNDMQKYTKEIEDTNLPMAMRDVAFIDSYLARLPGYDEETGDTSGITDVPGIGLGQNAPFLGPLLTFGEGVMTGEDEVDPTQMKAAIQKMKNTVIKDISGSQVTVNEMVRQTLAQASDWTSSDEDFIKFWPEIKGLIADQKRNVDAGFSPEVTGLYDLRQSGENITARDFLSGGYQSGPEPVANEEMDWMMGDPSTWTEEQQTIFEKLNGL